MTDRRFKLTTTQRDELIQRRRSGVMLKVLAHNYGVSMTHVKRLAGPIYPEMSRVAKERACS